MNSQHTLAFKVLNGSFTDLNRQFQTMQAQLKSTRRAIEIARHQAMFDYQDYISKPCDERQLVMQRQLIKQIPISEKEFTDLYRRIHNSQQLIQRWRKLMIYDAYLEEFDTRTLLSYFCQNYQYPIERPDPLMRRDPDERKILFNVDHLDREDAHISRGIECLQFIKKHYQYYRHYCETWHHTRMSELDRIEPTKAFEYMVQDVYDATLPVINLLEQIFDSTFIPHCEPGIFLTTDYRIFEYYIGHTIDWAHDCL